MTNTASNAYAFVGGGQNNTGAGLFSFIGGGSNNIANGTNSFVGGGDLNTASGIYSSIVAGRRSKIESSHSGAGVWADGQDRDHNSRGEHSCSLDFASGVYLRLPEFTGSSSQIGNIGELKVSGSGLYICTGINLWGRTFISTF